MSQIIFHIDMDSYFASVEQQANPVLRGKPIAVGGKPGERTVVAAASREAKKLGIKTAMSTWEAKKILPEVIIVPGDPDKYLDISRRIFKIFRNFTPYVEVFSIDEAFLKIQVSKCKIQNDNAKFKNKWNQKPFYTHAGLKFLPTDWREAGEIALKIKRQIAREVGEYITCSVGIASNKNLAKLASEHQKPNGLVIVPPESALRFLQTKKLTDICGIGSRLERSLRAIGINTIKDLRNASSYVLRQRYGVMSVHLKNWASGLGSSEIEPFWQKPMKKSIGHSETLKTDIWQEERVLALVARLSRKVGRRLRAQTFTTRKIGVYLRFADFSGVGKMITLGNRIFQTDEIFHFSKKITRGLLANSSKQNRFKKPVRLASVWVADLASAHLITQPLFIKDRQKIKVSQMIDELCNRFGERTVFRAQELLIAPEFRVAQGFGGKQELI